jgi:outer membrane protein assembly factor BamB
MSTVESTNVRPLRLWPAVVIVILATLLRFGLPVVVPDWTAYGVLGGVAGGLAILIWWLFFSRAPWSERFLALGVMIVVALGTSRILHESIAGGAMGMLYPLLLLPTLSLTFVVWAVISRHLSTGPRRAALVASILIGCGSIALIRTGGFTGGFDNDFHLRWTPTPEERLVAAANDDPVSPPVVVPISLPAEVKPPEPVVASPAANEPAPNIVAEWPGFRGPQRDGIVRGVTIATDWTASPPVQLWRRPIGPGWSSFAVQGDLIYTQEQRGEDEVVACYKITTGEPVWRHRDAARFYESNGGAGPRGTPTLHSGRVYSFGATGIVNALDARNGAVVWSHNAGSDTGAPMPDWGFSSSPLVLRDIVIVATSGRLIAYDIATGKQRWIVRTKGGGYSSPHLATFGDVEQIVLLTGSGPAGISPADGMLLWEHAWQGDAAIIQPALTANGDLLVTNGMGGLGTRRLGVSRGAGGWSVEEKWTSNFLKPSFNDYVVHKNHAYGFDGSILASIDLDDGKRKWKGGRYGSGQLVLLPDQDLLLVLSEEGELALVKATPDQFTEVARFPAIEGKTWNHPVLVGDVLLVRNSEEMAAFRLPLAR